MSRIQHAPDHGEPVPATPRRQMTVKRKLEVMVAHGRCFLCGDKLAGLDDTEFDHVLPLDLGGADTTDNIAPVHAACHKAKTARDANAIAKGKRIRGETKQGPKRKILSRPFPGKAQHRQKEKA